MSISEERAALEQAIEDAEKRKREFVREHADGSGDPAERKRLYNEVERARRALREFKIRNQLI